jgi:hypothetical protein
MSGAALALSALSWLLAEAGLVPKAIRQPSFK